MLNYTLTSWVTFLSCDVPFHWGHRWRSRSAYVRHAHSSRGSFCSVRGSCWWRHQNVARPRRSSGWEQCSRPWNKMDQIYGYCTVVHLLNVRASGVITWVCWPIHAHTNPTGRLKWLYAITRLTGHFMCGLVSDLGICKFWKSMVIHDAECPYWDQVSLNNTNQSYNIYRYYHLFLDSTSSNVACFGITTMMVADSINIPVTLPNRSHTLQLCWNDKHNSIPVSC